jgi:hypothetical protein
MCAIFCIFLTDEVEYREHDCMDKLKEIKGVAGRQCIFKIKQNKLIFMVV